MRYCGAPLSLTLGGGAVPTGGPGSGSAWSMRASSTPRAPSWWAAARDFRRAGRRQPLDARLNMALVRQRQRLGMYPREEAGSAIYVPAPKGHRPVGGMVLGLGETRWPWA